MPEISEERLKELEENAQKVKELESSNSKLLDDIKKANESSNDLKNRLEKIESTKLEEDGKIKELLDKEKLKTAELEEKYKNRTKETLKEKVRNQVSIAAKDCLDVDMALQVTQHKDLIKIDENNFN